MDDNARPHRTLAVEELLESEDITRMDWPAYSLDLNPIEHVWDALARRIAARLHHPENTQHFKQMLIKVWKLLPQEMVHQLFLSMRRRCEATITEDFGKRNMPRKRARRHVSQLREFERGLIIGMKTAGWSTRHFAAIVWTIYASFGVCRPLINGLPAAIFQQDNARPHTARVAQDFLRHFKALPWPTRSPDFSPVEHVLDQLKRQMPSCHSVRDLELSVQDLWAHLPQDNIRCLINSMPGRVAACIAAGGGPTRY
ncbi:uncharacterized protein TNCV_421921 [Trichonephila clavipes]|nr:uncharacterized protein TNCV_421921 [Trichonephila clavipes]